ncbi:hypothetical protein JMJ35_010566 [Cladonia borealis]|uniref:Heterokaryon incompatibility domain-containing protein n=1 Tax=Cladonia borealis TaxID=184061 RepID=A0AA39QQ74_9LECA|nr:hypothetical protein JMJ35_010566 [Cladonia borealis]
MEIDKLAPFSDLDLLQYSSLNINEFRLLKLTRLENRLDKSWPICELIHVAIADCPKYNALSYVWGPQHDRKTIAINKKAFSVSVNLCDALCALFNLTELHVVWVDAICINQTDDAEKVTQIPLMREIYSRAACVMAWVGREKDDSDILFTSMDYISDLLSKAKGRVTTNNLEDHGLPDKECVIWRAMNRFFFRPWFQRLWVYQEIILAKELTILCGSGTTTWTSLIRLTKEIHRSGLYGFLGVVQQNDSEGIVLEMDSRHFIRLVDKGRERYMRRTGDESMFIASHFRDTRTLHCTFNVDRVYGLLGLVSENVQRRIEIDYSLEERFWEVWISAGKVVSSLQQDSFHILLEISDHSDPEKKCPELPSWFPDLRLRDFTFRSPFLRAAAAAGDNGNSPELRTFEDSDNLCVLGVSVDVVEDEFPSKWCWPDRVQKLSGVPAGLEWHRNCLELARVSKMRTQDHLEDYLITLTAGALDSSDDGEFNWHRDTPLNQSKETFYRMITFLDGLKVEDSTHPMFLSTHPFEVEFLSWAYNIGNICLNRSFFTTKHGRIGLGPSSMIKGDKICIFQGMPWPAVLRWNGEKSAYFFVGLAYTHGIMAGEAFRTKEDQNDGVIERENFTIY